MRLSVARSLGRLGGGRAVTALRKMCPIQTPACAVPLSMFWPSSARTTRQSAQRAILGYETEKNRRRVGRPGRHARCPPQALAFGVAIFAPLGAEYAAEGRSSAFVGAAMLGMTAAWPGGAPRLISAPAHRPRRSWAGLPLFSPRATAPSAPSPCSCSPACFPRFSSSPTAPRGRASL